MKNKSCNILKKSLELTVLGFLFFDGAIASASQFALDDIGGVSYLAYGDIRGYVEPCGCDPKTDLGGLRRIGGFALATKKLHPQAFILSLGNNVPVDAHESAKLNAILEFEAKLPINGALYNVLEQKSAKLLSATKNDFLKDIPYVLSHPLKSGTIPSWVKNEIFRDNYLILGFSFGENVEALLSSWKTKWLGQATTKILLFAGKNEDLLKLTSSGFFNLIVTSNNQPFENEPNQFEKENESLLSRARSVFMVPCYGQGLVASNDIIMAQQKLQYLLSGQHQKSSGMTHFLWLAKSFEQSSDIDPIMQTYNQSNNQSFKEHAMVKLKSGAVSPYAGAKVCSSCHSKAYKVWQESAHKKALVTLENKAKDQDLNCVGCHVLGLDEPGGFIDKEHTLHLSGVQCETCHGAGLSHTQNPLTNKPLNKNPKDVCESCHKMPHTSQFMFDSYWPKIIH